MTKITPTLGSIMQLESFTPATDATRAFWDFYALNFLYFKVEGWRSSYKTTGSMPVPELRVKHIREAFWKATVSQATYLSRGIMKAIADEFENIFDEFLVNPESVKKWGNDNLTIYNKIMRLAPPDCPLGSIWARIDPEEPQNTGDRFWQLFRVVEARRVFDADFWRERSDAYGGAPWAAITTQFGKLVEAMRSKDMTALAIQVDLTYDLDHNTGSISSKFPKNARVSKETLDQRHDVRSFDDFVSFVSPGVARLIKESLRLGESISLAEVRAKLVESEKTAPKTPLTEILGVEN